MKPPHYSWAKSPPLIYSNRADSYKFLDKIATPNYGISMVQNYFFLRIFIFMLSSWTSCYYICCRDSNNKEAQRLVETQERRLGICLE